MRSLRYASGLLVILCIYSANLGAQSLSLGVFESVEVDATEDGFVIKNYFSCPLRYISHYPWSKGDELSIRIEPVPLCKSDTASVKQRGSIRPRTEVTRKIVEVVYEGDNFEGPSLVVYFNEPVKYRVSQGDDYRSVDIDVTLDK